LGGRALVASERPAVVESHHALDDGEVGPGRTVREERPDQLRPDEYRVEVAPGPAAGQRVVPGVDVVRPDLEPGHPYPLGGEGGEQSGGDGGLAVPGCRRGDDDPRDVYHSMPCCPLRPASIGCLTLLISVTRSATSTSSGAASRPVMTTC